MYLLDVTIHGFKSFAKKSDLTFPAPVTAIVGPNGSGKSNVAEALRFVLGEQSVKSLRGKRGEDLIWGGSDAIARTNRASVQITLQNESRVLPLDTDRIVIERVVHRDGQNEYKINDQQVRLKDVHELLAAGNIGPSGHHIISQGEADRVLSASGRERRAMIEESLGLKVYQFKKQDAERKLVKTRNNIAEVQNLRKEIAPHLAFLKRELDKLAESRALREKLQVAMVEYLRREDVYLAHQFETLTRDRKVLQDELSAQEQLIGANQKRIDASKKTDTTDDKLVALTEAVTSARTERLQVEQKIHHLNGQVAILERQLQAEKVQSKEVKVPLQEVVERFEKEFAHVQSESDTEKFFTKITQAIKRMRDWFSTLEEKPLPDTTKQVEEEFAKLQAEIDTLEKRVVERTDNEKTKQQALDEYRHSVAVAQNDEQAATRELYEAKTIYAEKQVELRRVEHELDLVERERAQFKDELQEAVALLGRGVARYFDETVSDDSGEVVTIEQMQSEERSHQLARKRDLEKLKIRLETLGQGESEGLEKEYQSTKERDDFLAREVADLESSVETLESLIEELDTQIDTEFQAGFKKIQAEFQNFFTLMFGGGTAELQLVVENVVGNTDDDTEEGSTEKAEVLRGVEVSVTLPNKRVQSLAMLSGGERALTSIALIFALSQVYPPLFIVLDETDAALDEANSRRYGDLIEALAKRSQLILITHNRETMSRAGVLYGVTMGSTGASKLLSVQLDEAVVNAK